ncbi:porin [Paraburkholderia susongensis]|uniref:Outer membrane protein (Porin) n=1 Tax=Paraburkholderia susongensis TaxID=1515439 RepID=A0A1X7LH77_9BURK|nr:porin [Paraburkholderia susongensis]SMG53030.1 Outer membrane protein (porin) [Paraburkholderia susongensis]
MRRLTIAAAIAMATAGSAYAQSSVTLYGIVSTGITYISNQGGKSNVRLDSGINQADRFGFRGNEDLGGGLRAIFTLESGFDLSTGKLGNGGALFGRRAYVGMASDRFGTLTLGRDYDFVYDFTSLYSNVVQFAPSYSFHLAYDIDRIAGEAVNNAVKYRSPQIAGFVVGGMYGFSNVAGSFGGAPGNPRVYSVGFTFVPSSGAPYSLAGAFTKTNGAAGTLAQIALNANSIETAAAGGRVTFGPVSLNGLYTYTNATSVTGAALITQVYEAGLVYQFTPFLNTGAGYAYIDQRTGKFHLVSATIDYRLSKRTDVYLFGTWQHAFAGAGPAGNFLVVTPGTTNGYSSSANQLAVQLGIRQLF